MLVALRLSTGADRADPGAQSRSRCPAAALRSVLPGGSGQAGLLLRERWREAAAPGRSGSAVLRARVGRQRSGRRFPAAALGTCSVESVETDGSSTVPGLSSERGSGLMGRQQGKGRSRGRGRSRVSAWCGGRRQSLCRPLPCRQGGRSPSWSLVPTGTALAQGGLPKGAARPAWPLPRSEAPGVPGLEPWGCPRAALGQSPALAGDGSPADSPMSVAQQLQRLLLSFPCQVQQFQGRNDSQEHARAAAFCLPLRSRMYLGFLLKKIHRQQGQLGWSSAWAKCRYRSEVNLVNGSAEQRKAAVIIKVSHSMAPASEGPNRGSCRVQITASCCSSIIPTRFCDINCIYKYQLVVMNQYVRLTVLLPLSRK